MDGVRDVIGRAKGVSQRVLTVLAAMHEGAFPEKEVPATLDALAESFDTDDTFVWQFSQAQTVRDLGMTSMVLLGHGLQTDFDSLVMSVPSMPNSTRRRTVELTKKLQETLMEFTHHDADQ